jgi:NAD(P)-dependent dehydrogenase (short-subunit alcohol dehydrogenase family)
VAATSPAVLITGATGKLGRTFALGFAGMGASVAFTSRGGKAKRELEKECLSHGAGRALAIETDLTAGDAASRVVQELREQDFLPSVLINNARNRDNLTPDSDGRIPREHWNGELLLGVILPYELTMKLAEVGSSPLKSVINIASIYGVTASNLALYERPDLEAPINYGVAKAALIHLTKELAVRLAPRAISVNAVSYGGVSGRATEEFEARYARLTPAGRMLDDAEVFGAVKFLASSDARGMTGHNLIVDGGWTVW